MSTDDSDASDGQTNPRVAVDVLHHDQQAFLFAGDAQRDPPLTPLTNGFRDRRDLINWRQAAAVRTFGRLSDVFPPSAILRDEYLVAALTATTPTPEQRHLRDRLIERTLVACEAAKRDMEARAQEWLADSSGRSDKDYSALSPTRQRHIGMRPAFSRLDVRQSEALDWLWGGFDSRDELHQWVHSLPSIALFDRVLERPLPEVLAHSDTARANLLAPADDSDASEYRERFAAGLLLPAFTRRARTLRGGERAADESDDDHIPQG